MARIKHGHALCGRNSPTYRSWAAMMERCTNPKNKRYARYGGRGIAVCERWSDFAAFLADMGEKPVSLTLDRINNDGNYEPDNCRWATSKQQGRTNYQARLVTAFGKTQMVSDWAAETGIKRETICRRLNDGWWPENALSKPAATVRYGWDGSGKQRRRNITANGKTMCLAAWALEVGIPAKALQHRLNRGWPVEKALSPLVRKRGSQEPEIVEG